MQELVDYPPVGFAPIDQDHREIAVALRRLVGAVRNDDTVLSVPLADALIARTGAHFALEERLMEEIGFTFFPRHKRTHDRFLEEAQRVLEELRAQGLTTGCLSWTAETMGWYRAHVLTEDMSLGRALVAAGLAR